MMDSNEKQSHHKIKIVRRKLNLTTSKSTIDTKESQQSKDRSEDRNKDRNEGQDKDRSKERSKDKNKDRNKARSEDRKKDDKKESNPTFFEPFKEDTDNSFAGTMYYDSQQRNKFVNVDVLDTPVLITRLSVFTNSHICNFFSLIYFS